MDSWDTDGVAGTEKNGRTNGAGGKDVIRGSKDESFCFGLE